MPPSNILSSLTRSGYLKRDIYEELNSAIEKGEAHRACCLSVELACTPNEAKQLSSSVIQIMIDRRRVSQDARFLRHLANAVRDVHTMSSSTTNAYMSSTFRLALGRAILMLCKCRALDPDAMNDGTVTTDHAMAMLDVSTMSSSYPPSSTSATATRLSMLEQKIHDAFSPSRLQRWVLGILTTLCRLASEGDARRCMDFATAVVRSGMGTKDDPEFSTRVCAGGACISYVEISKLPASQRHDVVWYMWRMILLLAPSRESKGYVEDALFMFQLKYRKAYRLRRLILLCSSLQNIMTTGADSTDTRGGGDKGTVEAMMSRFDKAMRGIDTLYDEVLMTTASTASPSSSSNDSSTPSACPPPRLLLMSADDHTRAHQALGGRGTGVGTTMTTTTRTRQNQGRRSRDESHHDVNDDDDDDDENGDTSAVVHDIHDVRDDVHDDVHDDAFCNENTNDNDNNDHDDNGKQKGREYHDEQDELDQLEQDEDANETEHQRRRREEHDERWEWRLQEQERQEQQSQQQEQHEHHEQQQLQHGGVRQRRRVATASVHRRQSPSPCLSDYSMNVYLRCYVQFDEASRIQLEREKDVLRERLRIMTDRETRVIDVHARASSSTVSSSPPAAPSASVIINKPLSRPHLVRSRNHS